MKKIYITIILVVLFLLTACSTSNEYDKSVSDKKLGASEDTIDNNNTDNQDDEDENEKIIAPEIELIDLQGNVVKLSDYRGKYVFLNFWATWCGPCRKEMPHIQKMYEEYELDKDEVVFLAVNLGESTNEVKEFIDDNGYSFKVLLDEKESVAGDYYIPGIPTTYFIDKEGYVLGYITGSLDELQMKEILEKVINNELK